LAKQPQDFWDGLGSFWDDFEDRQLIEKYWEGMLTTFTESSMYLYQQFLLRFPQFNSDIWEHKYLSFPIIWHGDESNEIAKTKTFPILDQYHGIFSIPLLHGAESDQYMVENIDYKIVDSNKIQFLNQYPNPDPRYEENTLFSGIELFADSSLRSDAYTYKLNRKLAEIETVTPTEPTYWPFTLKPDFVETSVTDRDYSELDLVYLNSGSQYYDVRIGTNHIFKPVDTFFMLNAGNSPGSSEVSTFYGGVTINFGDPAVQEEVGSSDVLPYNGNEAIYDAFDGVGGGYFDDDGTVHALLASGPTILPYTTPWQIKMCINLRGTEGLLDHTPFGGNNGNNTVSDRCLLWSNAVGNWRASLRANGVQPAFWDLSPVVGGQDDRYWHEEGWIILSFTNDGTGEINLTIESDAHGVEDYGTRTLQENFEFQRLLSYATDRALPYFGDMAFFKVFIDGDLVNYFDFDLANAAGDLGPDQVYDLGPAGQHAYFDSGSPETHFAREVGLPSRLVEGFNLYVDGNGLPVPAARDASDSALNVDALGEQIGGSFVLPYLGNEAAYEAFDSVSGGYYDSDGDSPFELSTPVQIYNPASPDTVIKMTVFLASASTASEYFWGSEGLGGSGGSMRFNNSEYLYLRDDSNNLQAFNLIPYKDDNWHELVFTLNSQQATATIDGTSISKGTSQNFVDTITLGVFFGFRASSPAGGITMNKMSHFEVWKDGNLIHAYSFEHTNAAGDSGPDYVLDLIGGNHATGFRTTSSNWKRGAPLKLTAFNLYSDSNGSPVPAALNAAGAILSVDALGEDIRYPPPAPADNYFELFWATYSDSIKNNYVGIRVNPGSSNIDIYNTYGSNSSYTYSEIIRGNRDYSVRATKKHDQIIFSINEEEVLNLSDLDFGQLNNLELLMNSKDAENKTVLLKEWYADFQIKNIITETTSTENLGNITGARKIEFYNLGTYDIYSDEILTTPVVEYLDSPRSSKYLMPVDLQDSYKFRREKALLLKYMSWALIYLKTKKPSVQTYKWLYNLLYNLPFAYEAGTAFVSGQACTVGNYTYYLPEGESWTIDGQYIQKFQPLTENVVIHDVVNNEALINSTFAELKRNCSFIVDVTLSSRSSYQQEILNNFNKKRLDKTFNVLFQIS
jgi:hypothetical protein